MSAPLCFVDTEAGIARVCALVGCTRTFRVAYPSTKQRFCSRSCGAASHAQHEGRANPKWRGGMTRHPLYAAYLDMVARCSRPTHHAWPRYGRLVGGLTDCARALDIDVPTDGEHTALGDARWARAVYDRVMEGGPA